MNVVKRPGRGIHPMFEDQSWFAALCCGGAFIVLLLATFVFSRFVPVSMSGWDMVVSISPWYVGIMSGWMIFTVIPLSVACGETRQYGFRVWLATIASISVISAIIVTAGYPLERLWYRIMDFDGEPEMRLMFADPDRLYTVFPQYLLVFMIWGLVGGMVGAGVYRDSSNGWLLLLPAGLMLPIAGVFGDDRIGFMGILRRLISDFDYTSNALNVVIAIVIGLLAAFITWYLVRTVPLRNK